MNACAEFWVELIALTRSIYTLELCMFPQRHERGGQRQGKGMRGFHPSAPARFFFGPCLLALFFIPTVLLLGNSPRLYETSGTQVPRKGNGIAWPDDYPMDLRNRKWNEAVQLIGYKEDLTRERRLKTFGGSRQKPAEDAKAVFDVAWAHRLAGRGTVKPDPEWLYLSPPALDERIPIEKNWTFIALDDDLERRWFEYRQDVRVEASHPQLLDPIYGVFFGWKELEEGKFETYLIQLPFYPDPAKPRFCRITAGLATFAVDAKDRTLVEMARFVPTEGKEFPLREFNMPMQKAAIVVRALPEKVRISINAAEVEAFTPKVDPRGPLGIFQKHRMMRFYEGKITALKG